MYERLEEQMKEIRESGHSLDELPWLVENEGRKARWAKYFTENYDLQKDKKLDEMQVSEIDREVIRRQVEVMLDNTMDYAAKKSRSLFETTATGDIATFTTWALPLIRKIWPRLFARELVSVQPMKGPTGRAHTLDFVYGTSGGAYSSGVSIYGSPDPDYSNDLGEGVEPREINLTVTAATLTAIAKKLKARWNQEAAQDLSSQHGLNLESEVIKILGMQIEREINRKLIDGVISAATTNTSWTSTQPASPNPWANATPKQYAESIFDAIADANKQIYDRVYQDANVIVCGSTFANRLTKLNGFKSLDSGMPGDANVMTGPNLFGVLNKQYRLFKDAYMSKDQALVAHKSGNWMFVGYVYAPYIPLWTTPVVWNTAMQPGRGMMSRYATYAKNGDFFATVTVS